MDLFDAAKRYRDAALVKAAGIYPYFKPLSGSDGPVVTIDGREVVMMGSNNYLGLTHHPEVLAAAKAAIDAYGTGCTGSRLLNGNLDLHEQLERELAAFLGKDAALVFSSGFLANAGVIGVLGQDPDSVLFSERENHASLIEGTRLAQGEVRVYRDLDDLEAQLATRGEGAWGHALVISDAVFSMTGRVVDVRRLAALRARFGFKLYLDDAHGLGVLGPQGRGTAHEAGVQDAIDVHFGTFSKSLASLGGFVAGDATLIDYLRHKARTLIFSAALPPASVAAALAALHVMQRDGSLLERLWRNVRLFREGAQALGYHTLGSRTPIVPLLIGSESLALRLCVDALELGVFATPVVHPAVPFGHALIRTSTTPAHTEAQLQRALDAFGVLKRRYPIPAHPDELTEATGIDFTWAVRRADAA